MSPLALDRGGRNSLAYVYDGQQCLGHVLARGRGLQSLGARGFGASRTNFGIDGCVINPFENPRSPIQQNRGFLESICALSKTLDFAHGAW
jgi:hypothetical protein